MYSSEDLEKLWFLYKLEGQPKNLSIESFCTQQGVSSHRSGGDYWYADRAVIGRSTAKRRFTVSGNHLQVCHTNGGHFFGEWRSAIQEESVRV